MPAVSVKVGGRRFKFSEQQQAALQLVRATLPHSKVVVFCRDCATACVGYAPGTDTYAPCVCCRDRDTFHRRKGGATGKPPLGDHTLHVPIAEVLEMLGGAA